ncbi:LLM class flavin-dependent oxidoreductase [Roseinatronobacter alkalisoli]|uniref:LLM class flavin-dependent oxidoreductase n=1 Tax=Roseinatronobacter alkalisoli TaxID=3028235 RepID=A0ABT5TC62_9RHOB|nr:LLM class flavin-dependent oxidoreductase [Roseinatronobacter sp. HJB301]MDD7972720.1 LLM class flavin-dependent oxidoreductase [Roseinatronobacter sp. HJB301]
MSGRIRVDLAGFAREGGLGDHADLIALAREADALGFGGIWFNEFHFDRNRLPHPSTLLLGAAILAVTERLRFGTSILVLPLYHPLLLAEQVAQLDRQSGGRLDVGVGRGTSPDTFRALGLNPDEARPRFAAALDILRMAWTQGNVSHDGSFWRFDNVSVGPPCVQRPHPPVYMAAVAPDNIDLAARHALPLLYSLEPNEGRQFAPYRAALARHGQGVGPLHASSLSRYVLIDRDRGTALAQLDALTHRLNENRAARAIAAGNPPPVPRSRAQMLEGHAIAGTPDDCTAQILDLSAQLHTGSIRAFFSANGAIPVPQARAAMRLFAAQVLPALTSPAMTKEICL